MCRAQRRMRKITLDEIPALQSTTGERIMMPLSLGHPSQKKPRCTWTRRRPNHGRTKKTPWFEHKKLKKTSDLLATVEARIISTSFAHRARRVRGPKPAPARHTPRCSRHATFRRARSALRPPSAGRKIHDGPCARFARTGNRSPARQARAERHLPPPGGVFLPIPASVAC